MDDELRKKLAEIEDELDRLTCISVPAGTNSVRLEVRIQATMIGLAVKDYDKRQTED